MAINRKVLDISHHNDVASWASIRSAGIVGIIHKATEGTGYTDDQYLKRCAPAMNAGLMWGAYHFANGSDVSQQVAHFLDVVGVDDETLYALDWENDPNGDTMSLDEARQFLQLMDQRVGVNRCVVYSGNVAKEALGSRKDAFFGAHRLWLAQYSSTPSCQASWSKYWIWQYSDGSSGPSPHGCPGVTGDVDTNSWDGGDDELRAQWTGAAVVPPAPSPEMATVDIVSSGPVKITINGKSVS
jgi:GH25 family lysozyme M1 (1,4-beta-N-acetylmuramidase)